MIARLRVAIDGYNIAMPNGTGVATYARTLAQVLPSDRLQVEAVFGLAAPKREPLREILFFEEFGRGRQERGGWAGRLDRWREPVTRVRFHAVAATGLVERATFAARLPDFARLWSAGGLFERAERHFRRTRRFLEVTLPDPPHIMHWTYPLPVRVRGARNVYTLHDLVPLKLPYATLDRKRQYLRIIETIVARGDHICTVSEHSRADILALPGVDQARVTNTWQGVTPPRAISAEAAGAAVRGLFGLKPQGYFLYYGAIEPKKNVGRLIEAYLSLPTKLPLVIVGARAWAADEELRLVRGDRRAAGAFGRSLDRRIIELGYLPRDLLMTLVQGARAVAFPSLYEGFGLPVLEAMQLGTPVVTSALSALPEVAGDAALLVDPYDVGAIAAALARVESDDVLAAALAERGRARAQFFAADDYRERLEAMYRAVMRQPIRR